MPDLPPGKRRVPIASPVRQVAESRQRQPGEIARYVELRCRSNFSFLEGASHPDELVARAAELGQTAIALTDRNSLAGIVRAHVAAKAHGLKLVVGAEVTSSDGPSVLLWVIHRQGYASLCRLLTRGRRNAPKGECCLTSADVFSHASGLMAGLIPDERLSSLETDAAKLREAFSGRAYMLLEQHRDASGLCELSRRIAVARLVKMPLVATNDVHYHVPERQLLQDVLTAIRHGCTVAELGERRFSNAERHLKSAIEMRRLFAMCPDVVDRTVEIAERCQFSLDELKYDYPEELCPRGVTPIQHLTNLTWRGAKDRYPRGVPEKVRRLIEHELVLIGELKYAAYFLTVWDLVRFARERDILCQGRGSAANSAVCYCLGVTSVDPGRIDVLFERFISRERNEAPDIDVDFEHERREEVIQYLYEKYGRERAAMTAEVITYRPRSAIRDVGKALGLSLDRVDALARHIDHAHDTEHLARRIGEAGLPPESRVGRHLVSLVSELLSFPRHLSQHVGGMVLANSPLSEIVPIENASMPNRTVIEWDKDDLDALGILKVDVLALGMLSAIRRCFHLVERHYGRRWTLASIPAHDGPVFDMIGRADTMGVFQIESRAQMSMLPRLKPRCFYDLVIEVAIVRPGPIQGDMVHPYLRRRCGLEPIEYPDERIRSVLEKTLGVPLFQEQAMRLVVVAAGFSPGEADQLRRAMGAWRKRGVIDTFRRKLIEGMTANGYAAEFAERVFRQIQGFGEYGFPESHACSFALLVWASAWLKHHYPAAFTAALLNSQPMGFYAPAQLVADARKHGVDVLPVDVNYSDWDCTLERRHRDKPLAMRLGFCMVNGLSSIDAACIVTARRSGSFCSMDDFLCRTRINGSVAARLSRADVFQSLMLNRRESLWQALPDSDRGPLFRPVRVDDAVRCERDQDGKRLLDDEPLPSLPNLTDIENVTADYCTTGLSLRDHPLTFLRPRLHALRVTPAWKLAHWPNNKRISVAGLVLLRQRPGTASGITFVTLEDESGMANLIVRPDVWERYRKAARTASLMLAKGIVQRDGAIVHVLVSEIQDLSSDLQEVTVRARDFR